LLVAGFDGPPPQSPVKDLGPIGGSVQVGSESAKDVAFTDSLDFRLLGPGGELQVKVTLYGRLETVNTREQFGFRLAFDSAEREWSGFSEEFAAAFDYSSDFVGAVMALSGSRRTMKFDASFTRDGKPVDPEKEESSSPVGRSLLIMENSGVTITQGEQIFDYGLTHLLEQDDRAHRFEISGIAEGIGEFEGRRVVSVRIADQTRAGGQLLEARGVYLMDVATGIFFWGHLEVSGIRFGSYSCELTIRQDFKL